MSRSRKSIARGWRSLLLLLTLAPVAALAAETPATRPAATTASRSDWSQTQLRRTTDPAAASPAAPSPAAAKASNNGLDTVRILFSLAAVIGLILLLRWGGAKLFGLQRGPRSSQAMQVLARTPMSPRQQLVLVQVGRRLVLVGDSGSQMSSLCEITDPDEIAALRGQILSEKQVVTQNFSGLIGRVRSRFGAATRAEPDSLDDPFESGLDDLPANSRQTEREQLLGDAAEEEEDTVAGASEIAAEAEPQADLGFNEDQAREAVAVARQELGELREKLRQFSRQFAREPEKETSEESDSRDPES